MKFWQLMLKPVNPSMCLLLGFVNILYSSIVLIPGGDQDHYYEYLDDVFPHSSWVLPVLVTGLAILYYVNKQSSTMASRVLAINGVLWVMLTIYNIVDLFYSALWVPTLAIALYSMLISANFSVNKNAPKSDNLT